MATPKFRWTPEEVTLKELLETRGDDLPQVVCVKDGFDDQDLLHSYASDEVYVLHAVERQTRVVVRDRARRLLSIPLDYPLYMHVVHKDGKAITQVQRPKLLKQILRRIACHQCRDNHVVIQENLPVTIQSSPGASYEARCEVLEVLDLHQLTYMVGNSLINGSVYPETTAIPLYLPLHVCVAEGLLPDTDTDKDKDKATGTDGGRDTVQTLEDYLTELLWNTQYIADQEELSALYNQGIMALAEEEIPPIEDDSQEETLRRIALRAKELRLDIADQEPSSARRTVAKRPAMDRTTLPPPPPPPVARAEPPGASARPHTIHVPALLDLTVGDTSAGAEDDRRDHSPPLPLPTKKPFTLHSLLPSGGFSSLTRIKNKVKERAGRMRKKQYAMDDSCIPTGGGDRERSLSPLSEYDYDDQWSDDSFDDEEEWTEEEEKQATHAKDETQSPPTSAPPVFAEMRAKLNPIPNESKDVDKVAREKTEDGDGDEESLAVKRTALKPPATRCRPSLPVKPHGHLERLSSQLGLEHSSTMTRKDSSRFRANLRRQSPVKASELKVKPQLKSPLQDSKPSQQSKPLKDSKPPQAPRPPQDPKPLQDSSKPLLPPKPKSLSTSASSDTFLQDDRSPASVFEAKKSPSCVRPPKLPNLPSGPKPAISQKPQRQSVSLTEKPATHVPVSNIAKKFESGVKDSAASPAKSYHATSQGTSMFARMKKKFDSEENADKETSSQGGTTTRPCLSPPHYQKGTSSPGGSSVSVAPGDPLYAELELPGSDRPAGDGAEAVDKSGQSDGRRGLAAAGHVTSKAQSGAVTAPAAPPVVTNTVSSSPDSIEELYAKPQLNKKTKKLAVVNPSTSPANQTIGQTSPCLKRKKFSSLSEVPSRLSDLSIQDVSECLALLKMSQYGEKFAENEVDGALLSDLDENVLQDMFSFSVFDAKKLVKFSSGWRPKLQ